MLLLGDADQSSETNTIHVDNMSKFEVFSNPGLKYIHEITSSGSYQLRVDIVRSNGTKGYDLYGNFSLQPGANYTLNIGSRLRSDGDDAKVIKNPYPNTSKDVEKHYDGGTKMHEMGTDQTGIKRGFQDTDYTSSKRQTQLFCGPCNIQRKIAIAMTFCPVCDNDPLCALCSSIHNTSPVTTSHTLLDVSAYPAKNEEGHYGTGYKLFNKPLFCGPCNNQRKTATAMAFCPVCDNDLLCALCSSIHNTSPVTNSHMLLDISAYPAKNEGGHYGTGYKLFNNPLFCGPCNLQRKTANAVAFCPVCDNDLLCALCSSIHNTSPVTTSHTLLNVSAYPAKTEGGHNRIGYKPTCNLCLIQNIETEAFLQCQEWKTQLCDSCSKQHKAQKATRSHNLIHINDETPKTKRARLQPVVHQHLRTKRTRKPLVDL
ncbi:uncharacterized protein LOC127845452 isoform X2 [Dreissena polymorpha]|uniref:uncharacterized protein LOC127845452 isoform X2 n=1 Tax=Dreissena polymorpha TaxID=45954 RepID=UPI0022641233|nr:uncharacterized protein LOC127845452 isoform X2 [Dreissena polymorpha]